jgi:hypothetical protein
VSSSSQFAANLVTKQIVTYATSTLSTNILNASLLGGHVFGSVAIKATFASTSSTSVTVRLSYCTSITGNTTVSTRDIEVAVPEGEAYNSNTGVPVMVSRPDNGTLEIWFTVSLGELIEPDEQTVYGARIYKLVVADPRNPATSDIETVAVGISPYAVGQYSNTAVGYYLSGFYYADLQNDDAEKTDNAEPSGVYYLPITYYRTQTVNSSLNSSSWAHGIKTNEDLTEIYGDYIARTGTASAIASPVFTDAGVLQCLVNSTTMYYVTLSGVVSGANFPQTLTKGADDVLRLIYEYSLT